MTFGALLSTSALTIAIAAGWVVAALAWLMVRSLNLPAPVRASLLAQSRLIPLAAAILLVPSQIQGFVRFEPEVAESVGPLLALFVLVGIAFAVDGLSRGWRSWMATRRIVRSWRQSATPLTIPRWRHRAWLVDRPYPVVAMLGVIKPELFVSRSVAAECTSEELAAIAEHEVAHVRTGDNLRRALFSLTPAARLVAPLADAMEREWTAAAEEAADASARQVVSGIDLAQALTKVARLAIGPQPEPMPGSALIRGLALESRVRLLLDPPIPARRRSLGWIPVVMLFAAAILLQSPTVLSGLHEMFELLVRR